MRSLWIWLILVVTPAAAAYASDCTKLEKDLTRLRKEFHEFVSASNREKVAITFDEVAAKLDEIVDIKNDMRKLGCKIPPRSKLWEPK
ncbi:MAG: hypothetical protein RDU20_03915 [Desulfomonilaceae bacterium]|nr:hypothetical protein [Desulfomonilaceae bacterium]